MTEYFEVYFRGQFSCVCMGSVATLGSVAVTRKCLYLERDCETESCRDLGVTVAEGVHIGQQSTRFVC